MTPIRINLNSLHDSNLSMKDWLSQNHEVVALAIFSGILFLCENPEVPGITVFEVLENSVVVNKIDILRPMLKTVARINQNYWIECEDYERANLLKEIMDSI